MQVSCFLAQESLALLSSAEKEQHVFCCVLVMLISHATSCPLKLYLHILIAMWSFSWGSQLFPWKASVALCTLCYEYLPMIKCESHNVKSCLKELLTGFFFILVLSERTPEILQTILIPRFELPLSTLGKNYSTLQLVIALEVLFML